MVDENGANYYAIKELIGVNFMNSKVDSCQMHYKNDINKALLRLGAAFRDEFKYIYNRMCTVATVKQYKEQMK